MFIVMPGSLASVVTRSVFISFLGDELAPTVSAGEADRLGWNLGAGAIEVDLDARLVKLCLTRLVGRVKSQRFHAQEVIAASKAGRHVKIHPTLVLDLVINSPSLAARVERILPNLEPSSKFQLNFLTSERGKLVPFQPIQPRGCCIIHLYHVGHDRSFV